MPPLNIPDNQIEAALGRLHVRLAAVRSFEDYTAVYTPEVQAHLIEVVSARHPALYAAFAPCITEAYLRAVSSMRAELAREALARP